MGEPKNVFLALHHHFLCLADAGLRLAGAEDGRQSSAEQTVLSAAVSQDPEGERELCARAMAALYHAHAAAIGMHLSIRASLLCQDAPFNHVFGHAPLQLSYRLKGEGGGKSSMPERWVRYDMHMGRHWYAPVC